MEIINYIRGDATQPAGDGNTIIVHVCNDIGAFYFFTYAAYWVWIGGWHLGQDGADHRS